MTSPLQTSTDDLPHPTTVVGGRYRVERRLGVGGMATVDLARDLELDRPVAIKRLHPHLVTDEAVDRFRREARAAGRLRHPGVVTIHDWGFDDDEVPYLVMEVVDGPSLRTALQRRGRLTPGELLAVLTPAVAGLAAAHDAGIVHRDVTPANVLLGHDGASKMADFGLARPAASAAVTVPDAVVGSPHYLSPEAARGEVLDARSDVYSLGCVLYECLTGRPPFAGGTAAVIATRRLHERVPPPSEVVPGLPSALDDIVRTATEPDPESRHEDAAQLLAELRTAVPGGPVPVDLRDGSDDTVVIAEHATRVLDDLGDPGEDDGGRGWFASFVRWLLVGLLLGGGAWVAIDQVVAPVTVVPDVTGQLASDARAGLEAAGFRVRVADERVTDPDVPEGAVVTQSVTEPARQVLTEVVLTVSAGPRTGTLPPLAGRDVTDARAAIEELGLDLTVTTTVGYDDDRAPGTVLTATPAGGATVEEGTTVTLEVSDGPAPVDLPNLVGELEAAASAELVGLGLVARVVERRYDPSPAGSVVAIDPAPGTTLRRGAEVGLTISDGPEPVEVPDVEGRSEADAIRVLEDAGFTVDVREIGRPLLFLASGIVDAQDPDPGTTRPRGDTVRIFVWE